MFELVQKMLLRRDPAAARRRRIVFLHIPKCAGSSVNKHFKANIGSGRSGKAVLLNSMTGSADDPVQVARAKAAPFVGGHFGWRTLEAVRGEAFCFTVIREPVARLQSLYRFCRTLPPGDPAGFPVEAAKRLGFVDFCLSDEPAVRAFVYNAQARTLASDYAPGHEVEGFAELALEHLGRLDLVIPTERLDEAWPLLAERTQTRLIAAKVRKNTTVGERGEPPTPEDLARIEARVWADRQLHEAAGRLYDTVRVAGQVP